MLWLAITLTMRRIMSWKKKALSFWEEANRSITKISKISVTSKVVIIMSNFSGFTNCEGINS